MDDLYRDMPLLSEAIPKVRQRMLFHIQDTAEPIRRHVSDLIESGGKMLRPAFFLLTAMQGRWKEAAFYDIAAALELLHIATLIHDDVIDQADSRRGVQTLHNSIGIRRAILSGDFLFSRCFAIASRYASIENGRALSYAVGRICESEIDQSVELYDNSLGRRDYIRRIAGKTAALFLLAFHAGASESGQNRQQLMWSRRAGYNIGMAFQIIDDILDYSGDPRKTGKPRGGDLKNGILTLPLIYAIASSEKGELPSFPLSSEDREDLITVVDRSGALDQARKDAARYTERAVSALLHFPDGEVRDELLSLSKKILIRSY